MADAEEGAVVIVAVVAEAVLIADGVANMAVVGAVGAEVATDAGHLFCYRFFHFLSFCSKVD